MSYSGYDIEDAVVLNKASVDRGFGRCIVLKRSASALKDYRNQTCDQIVAPPDQQGPRFQSYSALDTDGICKPGEKVSPGDILVNKQSPSNTSDFADMSEITYKPSPDRFKGSAPCYVDKVVLSSNSDTHLIIKVLLRHTRRPELGDKFSSRHGQKGVVGVIINEVDMPFNESVRLFFFFFDYYLVN